MTKEKTQYQPIGYYYSLGNKVPQLNKKYKLDQIQLKHPVGSNHIFDKNKIPITEIKGQTYYHPIAIIHFGINQYNEFINTGDVSHLKLSENIAKWLVNNQDEKTGQWFYRFDFRVGGMDVTLKAPWSSAMAQGVALSLLSRISMHVENPINFIKAAEKALYPLTIPVKEGGLAADFFGYPFYEEYPTQPKSFALNGYMFTLIGLYDFAQLHKNELSKKLFDRGMKTLIFALPFFDQNPISAYHLGHLTNPNRKVHVSEKYHKIHIRQLELLNSISPHPTLNFYQNLWQSYIKK